MARHAKLRDVIVCFCIGLCSKNQISMATAVVGNEKEKEETIIIRHYVAWASACVLCAAYT